MDGSTRERVGEWIEIRLDELGLKPGQVAIQLGVDPKTVNNVIRGRSAIGSKRYRWEDLLGWERGSLTRAYRDGIPPEPALPPMSEAAERRYRETFEVQRPLTARQRQLAEEFLAFVERVPEEYERRQAPEPGEAERAKPEQQPDRPDARGA
jgi:hypothetical protein